MMPTFDKLAYEKFYSFNAEPFGHINTRPGIRSHYNDFVVGKGQRKLAAKLASATGMRSGARCVIIGAGFGWTCEGLVAQGIEAAGTEISEWVLAEKDNTEETDLREYIGRAGLNPDTDEIIGDPKDSRTVEKVPAYKQAVWDGWIVGAEADARKKTVREWALKSEAEKKRYRKATGQWDYNPKMPSGPKPEWMINPLELYLRGGRTAPEKRTSAVVADEDGSTKGSRTAIGRLLSGAPTHIITEEVLNGLTDVQGLALCDRLAKLASEKGGAVYHVLSPLQPKGRQAAELNWKRYSGWRNHLDAAGFQAQQIVASVTDAERIAFAEAF